MLLVIPICTYVEIADRLLVPFRDGRLCRPTFDYIMPLSGSSNISILVEQE
jgi:hypothetical protein